MNVRTTIGDRSESSELETIVIIIIMIMFAV